MRRSYTVVLTPDQQDKLKRQLGLVRVVPESMRDVVYNHDWDYIPGQGKEDYKKTPRALPSDLER